MEEDEMMEGDTPMCVKCGRGMVPGQAVPPAMVEQEDSPGQMMQGVHVGVAPLVEVWKCPGCGHSFVPSVLEAGPVVREPGKEAVRGPVAKVVSVRAPSAGRVALEDLETEGRELEERAEKEREEIFGNVHTWRGVVLKPFSISRRCLWERLVALDGPLPEGFKYSENTRAWLGHACKLLCLCSHEPEAWAAVRGDLQAMLRWVDRWSDEMVVGDEEAEEAVTLGLQMWSEARKMRAVMRPDGKGGRGSGN
jgi:hypothetical protein